MSSIVTSSPPTASATGVLAGVPPILAGAFVEVVLNGTPLHEPGVHAMASSAGLVVGAWLLSRSHHHDVRRQLAGHAQQHHSDDAASPRSPQAAGVPTTALSASVAPSVTTKTLLTVLAGFSFWMLDVITSLIGFGTLFYTSGDLLVRPITNESAFTSESDWYDWQDDLYRTAAPRITVLLFLFAIPLALFFARRLRDAGQIAFPIAVAIYATGVFASNLHLVSGSGRGLTSLDFAWMLAGVLAVFVACAIGRRLAARTQNRYGGSRYG